ncbi:hypothetical protein COF64_22695 [Bacillus sp. AFS043905]|nr:hypothetical protein COF64_22695 [Bacillus sp. AFS043905]
MLLDNVNTDYTDPFDVVLGRYFKPPYITEKKGQFRIKGLENFVFPHNTVILPKHEASEYLCQLILDYWTISEVDDDLYGVFKKFNLFFDDQTAEFKKILQDSTFNYQLLRYALDKDSICKNDIFEYFKLKPSAIPSVLNSIKVISLETVIIILPFFDDGKCSYTHQQLMEFLYLNTIIQSPYFKEFYSSVTKFNYIWQRYLELFNSLSLNFYVPNDYKEFVNFSLSNHFHEQEQLAIQYPEILKCITFWQLFNHYKIQILYNHAMSSKSNSITLTNIDVSIPNSYEEALKKIDEIYPDCTEQEKAFCDVILFMITFQQKDYHQAVIYGEKLLYDTFLLDKIGTFHSRYSVLDLQKNCEILRLENNHVQGKISWGLLECYVQLQQFERGAVLLFTSEIFPLPLLKLYHKRHILAPNYKWNDVSKKLFRALSNLDQKDLLNFLSYITVDPEKANAIIQEKDLEIPIPILNSLLFYGRNLLEAKVPQLEDLYPLIVLARLLFGTRKEDEWEENEAGIILEEDLRLLVEFQMQMEIALFDSDLLVLAPERIGSHQTNYYSQNQYKDFSHRLILMIKVLIVTEEFVLTEFFIDLFKKYFYSFEELLELEAFFTKLLSSKNQKMEISVVKKLQEAIQATQSIEEIDQSKKDRLTNQLNYIQQIYTQVGQTAYYFSKTMKDEVIFQLLKDKLTENDFDFIASQLQQRWEKDFKNYHISSHQLTQVKENLIQVFGESWFKLEEKSREFLVSGIITYEELAPIPASTQIDFSGPIIPLSKAVEYELQKKIFIPYREKFKNEKNLNKIPRSLVNQHKNRLYYDNEMTLGSFKYMAGKNKYEKNAFMNYCSTLFKLNTPELENLIYEKLVDLIEVLRVNYRNRAAHIAYLNKMSAEECVALVTQTKKIMHLLATHYK